MNRTTPDSRGAGLVPLSIQYRRSYLAEALVCCLGLVRQREGDRRGPWLQEPHVSLDPRPLFVVPRTVA